jgi:hypothetical protein
LDLEQWRAIVWSDECSVEIGKGKRQKWVFRINHHGEKWKKDYIQPYQKSKGISIMVWAAIWGGGHSDISLLRSDLESNRQGFSRWSYLEILQNQLPSFWQPDMVFMQHTAIVVKEWLQEMAIESINWPPYSPDLNPIEHAWMRLKETIYQLDPHIESYRGTKEEIRRYFEGLIEQAWIEISQDYFNDLIESMPRRVEAVIAAQGWYTKY